MNTATNRKPADVIDQIIKALGETKSSVIPHLLQVKSDSEFTAPEAQSRHWQRLQQIVNEDIVADTPPEDYTEEQKAVIRIFTNNPNIV